MRALIVGAGVAGLTLAARLRQQGRFATVVERASDEQDGYAIGLYPLGSCVLHGLGCYDEFVAQGLVLERYELADHLGQPLQTADMERLSGEVGPWVMTSRRALVELLTRACEGVDIRRGVAPSSLRQAADHVEVTFSDNTAETFDVVLACDGMGSPTRDLVFGPQPNFDAGWVLSTWWTAPDRFPDPVAKEWWGHAWFFGVYPAPGAVMCAAGAPTDVMNAAGTGDTSLLLRRLLGSLATDPAIAAALVDATTTYPWAMRDVRARKWVNRRIALCGDAATGFLPTAGVGASNAMRAASALSDELSRADAATVPLALELYEKRCRKAIERNQTESRRLARVMFLRSRALWWTRDQVARRYPAERMLSQIIESTRVPF